MLVPFYRKGLVFHNKNISLELEAELLSFPRSKRNDVMDAFADIIWLMDNGERYFYPMGKPSKNEEEKMKDMQNKDADQDDPENDFYGESAVDEWYSSV